MSELAIPDREGWERHWANEAERWASLSIRARELAERLVDSGEANLARQAAITGAVAADKALLMSGQATSRSEHVTNSPEAADARLRELITAIRAREQFQVLAATSRPAEPAALETGD